MVTNSSLLLLGPLKMPISFKPIVPIFSHHVTFMRNSWKIQLLALMWARLYSLVWDSTQLTWCWEGCKLHREWQKSGWRVWMYTWCRIPCRADILSSWCSCFDGFSTSCWQGPPWVVLMWIQVKSGGLNGRPEKLPDICYSRRVLSSLAMIDRAHLIDKDKLRRFLSLMSLVGVVDLQHCERLARGWAEVFNEALNGFTDEGWSTMGNDSKDIFFMLL